MNIKFGEEIKSINKYPDICPHCHKDIIPTLLAGYNSALFSEAVFQCPNVDCKSIIIGYYELISNDFLTDHKLLKLSIGKVATKSFSDLVTGVSKQFPVIYNQAYFAEQNSLLEICGVGYRKSLEFLIKDYAIYLNPDKAERIKKTALAQVIIEFVTNANIKSVSSRAAWLGNDETHYVRRWETLDVQHLKKLIELTVHWIESEELTKSFINEMPETGPK